jgi:hypothetical protein
MILNLRIQVALMHLKFTTQMLTMTHPHPANITMTFVMETLRSS